MKTPLIDTHAHLSFPELSGDLKRIIADARQCGVVKIINVVLGVNASEIQSSIEASREENYVYNSIGIHPSEAESFNDMDMKDIEELIFREKPVAIGETGLDFYRPGYNRIRQVEIFKFQINLAKRLSLPLIIHQRNSFTELIGILDEERVFDSLKVVFHCFGGNSEEARQITDRGGHISLTGIVTFKKAQSLREVISTVPLERIMLETDAPYLAPEPKRGKRNEPAFIVHTAKKIAQIKKVSLEEIAVKTTENAVSFFSLQP